MSDEQVVCPECGGNGAGGWHGRCERCGGAGHVPRSSAQGDPLGDQCAHARVGVDHSGAYVCWDCGATVER